jgi:hypothetical protein
MMTEQTYTFMARGIQPLTSYLPDGILKEPPPYDILRFESADSKFRIIFR